MNGIRCRNVGEYSKALLVAQHQLACLTRYGVSFEWKINKEETPGRGGKPPRMRTTFELALKKRNKQIPRRMAGYLFGVPDTVRTCDLQSRSLSLYPAELQAQRQHGYYSLGGGVCQWKKGQRLPGEYPVNAYASWPPASSGRKSWW